MDEGDHIVLSGDEVDEEVGSVPTSVEVDGKEQKKYKPSSSVNPRKRQRKLTSPVWQHFDVLETRDAKGNIVAICKKCKNRYIAESSHGTGNFKRHYEKCKGKEYKDVGQLLLQTNLKGSVGTRTSTYNSDEFRELVAVAIARHNLPLQFVEYEGIRRCFAYLCPEFKTFSRNTIKADIHKIYMVEKSKLVDFLQLVPGRISLTSDCWTSVTTDGYISLTAHFVDQTWGLQKRILAFSNMPPPHTGAALADKVYGLLKHWGIQKKVISITLDNASSNDAMADCLKFDLDLMCNGDYFHVRCCAHILNLIVQDGLKALDEAVKKVRECAKYCKGSQVRRNSFLGAVQHVGLESTRGLRQDVCTRWNSTYLMLDSALFYKKALLQLAKTDANFVHCPTLEEWSKIEKICNFLKVFYEVTLVFSGSKYPTANLYFPNVLKVRLLLKNEMESSDSFIKSMACKMHLKFDKYWCEFSTIMGIAVVFDPRYKFQVIDWAYKKIYGASADVELDLFKKKLFALFDEYAAASSKTKTNEISSHSAKVGDDVSDTFMTDFDDFSGCEFTTEGKSELESYLEEPKLSHKINLDVLDYWKPLQGRYPIVSQMARDILAIPISTVASESVFSIGGRVLDAFRSSLKAEVAEELVCLRDWVFNQSSLQPEIEALCKQTLVLEISEDDNKTESGPTSQTQESAFG